MGTHACLPPELEANLNHNKRGRQTLLSCSSGGNGKRAGYKHISIASAAEQYSYMLVYVPSQ